MSTLIEGIVTVQGIWCCTKGFGSSCFVCCDLYFVQPRWGSMHA